jgi:hypothetical protein
MKPIRSSRRATRMTVVGIRSTLGIRRSRYHGIIARRSRMLRWYVFGSVWYVINP